MSTLKLLVAFAALLIMPGLVGGTPLSDRDIELPKILNYKEFADRVIYPMQYPKLGIEGHVLIQIRVDENGTVEKLQGVESSHARFDKACLKHVENLTFSPAKDAQGRPAPSLILLPITFELYEAS